MPNKLGEQETRGLLAARTLLDRAILAVDGSDPGAITAVVLSDLAVETGAKAALTGRPIRSATRDPNFHDVMTALLAAIPSQAGTGEPPEVVGVRRLRELRNLVQHDGHVPQGGDVERQRIRAEDFLRWLTQEMYGVELEAISRSQLVSDERVRDHLIEAESRIASEEYRETASSLALAFEYACLNYREQEAGSGLGADTRVRRWPFDVHGMVGDVARGDAEPTRRGGGRSLPSRSDYRSLSQGLGAFAQMLDSLWERVEALSLGADAAEHGWFRREFPTVFGWPEPGAAEAPAEREYERDEVIRGYDFVVRTVLRWQQFPTRPRVGVEEQEDET